MTPIEMSLYLSLLSMVLALILLAFNWKVNRNALFLSLLMILIASGQTRQYFILHGNDPFWLAILINNPAPLWSMTGPCLYFYVRSVLSDRIVFRKTDWLHTLPFWVSLVGTLPYLLTPFFYKIEVANQFIHHMAEAGNIGFNWIMSHQRSLMMRYAVQIGYALVCMWMLARFLQRRRQLIDRSSGQGWMILKWLVAVSVFVGLVGVYYIVGIYLYYQNPSLERNLISNYRGIYVIGVALNFLPSLVLAFPEILYGIPRLKEARHEVRRPVVVESSLSFGASDPSTIRVLETAKEVPAGDEMAEAPPLQELGQRVLDFMEREKPYLSRDFSIEDLADMLGVPRHHMYYCFKKVVKKKFVTLRSELRVREAQRQMLEADLEKTTLFAIGLACGFSSHSAFYRTFREVAGCSPGEYLERHRASGGDGT